MELLDGKYEILTQTDLSESQSEFQAMASDGERLRIVWFDLKSSQEERAFERYRQCLRRLKKAGLAAIYDIVARPGSYYVAWRLAPPKARTAKPNADMLELFERFEFDASEFRICSVKTKPMIYDAHFRMVRTSPEIPVLLLETLTPETDEAESGQLTEKVAKKHGADALVSWSITAGLLLLALGFFLIAFQRQMNAPMKAIPDVLGQPINEAVRQLEKESFSVTVQALPSEDQFGEVVRITPSAGTLVRPYRRTVQLSYAAEAQNLRVVPQLRGQVYTSEIQTVLEKAGLRLGSIAFIHANYADGSIISQSEEANTTRAEGSKVDLLVSLGPEVAKTFLPDLVGLSLDEALELVTLAGLDAPDITRQPSQRYPENTVIAQSLPAFTEISLGDRRSILRLSVAGQATETSTQVTQLMPSLIGLSLDSAQSALPNSSFLVEEVSTANLPAGIISQTPNPRAALSATVNVLINNYVPPQSIPIPNIEGSFQEPAPRELNYEFFIEQGIADSRADVFFVSEQGELLIASQNIRAGETLQGAWQTKERGQLEFVLKLNNIVYKRAPATP